VGSRRDQVHGEVDREHVPVGREQRVGGVTAGRIGDRGDRAGVHEAVLLGQVGPVGQPEFGVTRSQSFDRHA
jgi:hypothetical protein